MLRVCDAKASHCSCRDCFAVVMGPIGTLCEDCREASCDAFYEPCRRSVAYAPRPKASCWCCSKAARTGCTTLDRCVDCQAAGCDWGCSECLRTDLEPYTGQTPAEVQASVDAGGPLPPEACGCAEPGDCSICAPNADDWVCLDCGGPVAALGDDLCTGCAATSRLPRVERRPAVGARVQSKGGLAEGLVFLVPEEGDRVWVRWSGSGIEELEAVDLLEVIA